ncbi:MAG: PepSY domain-containing protein [Aestuariivirga sp.]|uniref:PepSY domain-containing protein n=1 Tax=Aestuariivirga sp. TaxID=2650926 RepID=UPI003016C4F2
MTTPSGKTRIRRRGALLLILSSLAAALPLTGLEAMQARADDGGGSGGSGGSDGSGGSRGTGSDDSGSDDGGGDSGSDDGGGDSGNDDGGDDGGDDGDSDGSGSSNSGSGRSGSSSQGSKSDGKQQGQPNSQRDGALAVQLKGRIAPIGEVETIAGKAVPGEIIDVRLYRKKDLYVYRVKIIQRSGSIYDVRIDAVTRKVLSARER